MREPSKKKWVFVPKNVDDFFLKHTFGGKIERKKEKKRKLQLMDG